MRSTERARVSHHVFGTRTTAAELAHVLGHSVASIVLSLADANTLQCLVIFFVTCLAMRRALRKSEAENELDHRNKVAAFGRQLHRSVVAVALNTPKVCIFSVAKQALWSDTNLSVIAHCSTSLRHTDCNSQVACDLERLCRTPCAHLARDGGTSAPPERPERQRAVLTSAKFGLKHSSLLASG